MSKDRENKYRENKTTWFLNVIVFPHLEKLHRFYSELPKKIQESKQRLKHDSSQPDEYYLILLANEKKQLRKDISEFFDFINPLVNSYSSHLGKEIQIIKNKLEDLCIDYLDDSKDVRLLNIDIANNKQCLLQKLNSEISIDTNSQQGSS